MGTVTIPQNFIDEWNRIEATWKSLNDQGIERQWMAKKQEVERKQMALQAEQQKLAQARDLAAKEQKDVEKMNRPGLTKFAAKLKGNADEKTAKEKRELEQALANVKAQEQRVQAVQADLQQEQQAFQYVNTQYDTWRNSARAKDELLGRVFDGGLGDDQENRLEHELAMIKPDFQLMERRTQDDAKALDQMKNAVGWCAKSMQCMQQAQQSQNMDMITNIGRNNDFLGNMANIQKRQALNGAKQCIHKAADHVDRARDFIPEIQRIDPNLIKTIDGFADIIFDNMFMDMAVGRQIQQSYQRIAQTYQHLQQGAQWVQGRCNENKTRFDDLKRRYDGKRDELMRHRTNLMTQAASGASWSAGDRSQFGAIPTAAAPPAYAPYPGDVPPPNIDFTAPPPMPEAGTDASNFKLPLITPGPNCTKCQGALPADAKFCHQCGTPTLPGGDASPSAPPPPGYPTN